MKIEVTPNQLAKIIVALEKEGDRSQYAFKLWKKLIDKYGEYLNAIKNGKGEK
jgi:hypothetical protein